MATRLFFRASTDNTAGFVATEKSTVLPVGTSNQSGNPARDLSTTAGTSAVLGNFATLAQTAHQDGFFRKFISPPLAATSISAQTWTLGVSIGESNNAANAFIVCSVYVLTSADTVRGFIYDSDTPLGAEWSLGANAGRVVTFSGAAVSGVVSTDRLVVEFWYHCVQSMAVSYLLDFGYDGTTDIVDGTANADPASYIETPQNGLFAGASFNGTATAALVLSATGTGNYAPAVFNGAGSASLVFAASGTGDYQAAVFNGTATASLAFTASATGNNLAYAIFRRTPQTGAVFDPDVDTPIAEVVTSPYVDNNLAAAGYDYQVFRRTTTGWSVGSNVEQVTVSAGEFNGSASASLVLSASATGATEYNGTASASLAFTATGTGNFAPAGFNGQGSASLVLSATGTGDYQPAVYNGTATASLVLTASGQGDAGVPTWNGTGSASIVLSATSQGFAEYERAGSAGLVLTATGTGQFVPAGFNGQGSANLTFTASGIGAFDPIWNGTGSALLEFTASGTGSYEAAVYTGTGSANLIITASGIGAEGALPFIQIEFTGSVSTGVEAVGRYRFNQQGA